ncbi:MAG: DUF1581 domain-containing protein, partial [Planctomycetota bacterium]
PKSIKVDPTLIASVPRSAMVRRQPTRTVRVPDFLLNADETGKLAQMERMQQRHQKILEQLTLPEIADDGLFQSINLTVMLADAAAAAGQTAKVAERLRELSKEPGDAASCILAVVLQADAIANGNTSDELVTHFNAALATLAEQTAVEAPAVNPYMSRSVSPAAFTLTVRALQSGVPRKATVEDWDLLRKAGTILSSSVANYVSLRKLRRQLGLEGFSPTVPVEGFMTNAEMNPAMAEAFEPALFATEGELTRLWSSGASTHEFAFPFPLVGDFTVSLESSNNLKASSNPEQDREQKGEDSDRTYSVESRLGYGVTGLDLEYGDIAFRVDAAQDDGSSQSLTRLNGQTQLLDEGRIFMWQRNQVSSRFSTKAYQPRKWNRESIHVSDGSVSAMLGDATYAVIEDDFSASPWLRLRSGYGEVVWKNLRIRGDATIPREVDLISDKLLGFRQWGVATLPPIELPTKLLGKIANQTTANSISSSGVSLSQAKPDPKQPRWVVDENVMRLKKDERSLTSQTNANQGNPSRMALLYYTRPLLDGETVSGQLKIPESDAEKVIDDEVESPVAYLRLSNVLFEVSPASAVTARLFQTEAPTQAFEVSTDGPKFLPGWNDFELKMQDGRLSFILNKATAFEFVPVSSTTFGFGGDVRHGVEFRSLRLTGPWPEQVPESWQMGE